MVGRREGIGQDVLESLLEGCQVISPEWRYLYVNDSVVRQGQRSREQLLGNTMMACYPGIETTPMFDLLRRCMAGRVRARLENEFTLPDGSLGWFELNFVPVPEGVCILSLDVTDRKRAAEQLVRAEEQLGQAQKMEAVGRLAGGVAHDFNNILSVILSYGELLLQDLPANDPVRFDVAEITLAGKRAAELTRQLLLFSHQRALEPSVVDLNQLLANMEPRLRRVLGDDVELACRTPRLLGHVRVDPGDLERIVTNLVVNARDAMPQGGKLTLETADVVLDDAYALEHHGVAPGPHVLLAVTDSGTGIDRATRARIFEPFFTTKGPARGTGFGLATVFGIVQQSGGHVGVSSEPGQGTTFKIYLPRVDAHPDAVAPAPTPATVRGTETILLVEDDAQVRAVALGILRKHGYAVLEAADATQALAVAADRARRIDLLVTDVVMSQMSGPELAVRLAADRPDLKVLHMSGSIDDGLARHGKLAAGAAYLQKPLTPASLTRKVREVLDARAR